MTSFVHPHFASSHPGAERLEAAVSAVQSSAKSFTGSRGLATLLLAAMVSALVVVANQVIESVSDGHLFAAWIALWTIAFTALALFAAPARRLAGNLREGWAAWTVARKAAAADERLWSIALQDARVMADIQAAMSRNDAVTMPRSCPRTDAAYAQASATHSAKLQAQGDTDHLLNARALAGC
jgi:hypothetical protein